ncbi:hypothetical protein ACLI1A_17880 [Flavobacterium sp. RHBU_3]|uniref:hypothetical protein n=1 Tax=Flavobacterium sp. RHBU_3 TaxID=3391184 RepID=UPI0039846E13
MRFLLVFIALFCLHINGQTLNNLKDKMTPECICFLDGKLFPMDSLREISPKKMSVGFIINRNDSFLKEYFSDTVDWILFYFTNKHTKKISYSKLSEYRRLNKMNYIYVVNNKLFTGDDSEFFRFKIFKENIIMTDDVIFKSPEFPQEVNYTFFVFRTYTNP